MLRLHGEDDPYIIVAHCAPKNRRASIEHRGIRAMYWDGSQLVSWWFHADEMEAIDEHLKRARQLYNLSGEVWYAQVPALCVVDSKAGMVSLSMDVPRENLAGPFRKSVDAKELFA